MTICDGCGVEMQERDIALAHNLGGGPQYFCAKCKPPGTAAETIEEMSIAMLSVDDD